MAKNAPHNHFISSDKDHALLYLRKIQNVYFLPMQQIANLNHFVDFPKLLTGISEVDIDFIWCAC
jgi:hypothetical protein